MTPEQQARINIDNRLEQAGWAVQDVGSVNLYAGAGVAVREFSLKTGHGAADYLLYVNRKAAGVVEAKPEGSTLTGVEVQSGKYSAGLPDNLPAYMRPLPFLYESTGAETQFTNGLDPDPRSRLVFSFHTPETLAEWIDPQIGPQYASGVDTSAVAESQETYVASANLRQRLKAMPPLEPGGTVARAGAGDQQSRGVTRGRKDAGAGADGNRKRQDIHGLQPGVPADQARRSAASVVPCGPQQPGAPDPERVPGLHYPDEGRKFTELYNVQLLQSLMLTP